MAKLLDCEPIGSVEVIDPTLVVEVDLAAVYLTMGDVQLPAISGSWTLTDGFVSTYVVGVQFQYQPLDESSPPETTATQPKDRLGWATTSGIVAARQYAVSYRAAGNNVFGPWTTPETITAGSDMLVTDVSPTSPTNLANLDRLLDEALARFTADMNEEESREAAVTDTQRFIDRIGVVDPATGVVDMRDTARQIMVGAGSMHEAVERVDTGLSADGAIRRPVPRDVSVLSGTLNEMVTISLDGELSTDTPGGGSLVLGHVVRVQEATGFVGHDAFIRRSPSDGNLGGRMFFEKPLINTTLTGNLAMDVYQSAIRFFDATTLYGVTLPISAFQPSIGGRIVVSSPTGTVTGDVGSTTALRAPYARIGNAPGIGYLTLVEGDATYSGRAEFFNAAGARLGFVGLGNSTTLIMSAETGVNWAFDKRLDALAGAAVTGALTVSGLATLSGGAAVTGDIIATGAIAATGGIHSASFVRARVGSGGYLDLNPGDANYTGYLSLHNAAGTRYLYLGFAATSNPVINYAAENGAAHVFSGGLVQMVDAASVTGTLSVDGRVHVLNGNEQRFYNTGNGNWATIRSPASGALSISTGGLTDAVYVDTYGKVGVGTTDTSFGRLQVVGSAVGAGIFAVDTDATRVDIQSYNKPLAINRQGNNTLLNEGGGYVGFGRPTPIFKLDAAGPQRLWDGTNAGVLIGGSLASATATASQISGVTSGGAGYGDLSLNPNGGKVGINTASAIANLEVRGDLTGNPGFGQIMISGGTNQGKRLSVGFDTTADFAYLQAYENSVNYRSLALNPDGGIVVIGATSGSAKLSVVGSAGYIGQFTDGTRDLRFYTASGYGALGSERVGDDFRLYVDGTTSRGLNIKTGNGFVGVGTTSPLGQFHVVGSDGHAVLRATASTGGLRLRPYIDATYGLGLESINAAEDTYLPLSLFGSKLALLGGNVGFGTTSPTAKAHIDDGGANIPGLLIHKTIGGNPGIRLTTSFGGGSTVDIESGVPGISNGGFAITVDTVRRVSFLPGGDNGLNVASGRVHRFSTNGVDFGYISDNSATGGIYIAAEGGTNENIRIVPKGTGYTWVTSSLIVGGPIIRGGADHHFQVDAGQGFYFDVLGTGAVALLEASGRLSLNAITMGGFGLGEWTSWSPTPTAESGAATGLALVYARFTRVGNLVRVQLAVSQTAVDSAAGSVLVPLPYAAAATVYGGGTGENLNTAAVVIARVAPSATSVKLIVNNAYPMGAGAESLYAVFSYECA